VAVPDDSNPDVFAPSPKTPSGEIYAPITRSHTRTMTGAQIKFYADLWCAFHGIQLGYGSFARPVEEIARRTGRPLRTAERLLSSLEETGWIRDLNMSTWHDKPCRRYRLAETPQEAARLKEQYEKHPEDPPTMADAPATCGGSHPPTMAGGGASTNGHKPSPEGTDPPLLAVPTQTFTQTYAQMPPPGENQAEPAGAKTAPSAPPLAAPDNGNPGQVHYFHDGDAGRAMDNQMAPAGAEPDELDLLLNGPADAVRARLAMEAGQWAGGGGQDGWADNQGDDTADGAAG
jgi:DNA-binding transcriptional ArsR family regulator